MLGSMDSPAGRSSGHEAGVGGTTPAAPASAAAQRRRLDEIFGDVLPEVTGDELEAPRSQDDRWYLENRPPHHG
jgi:hypothetical protein